MRHRYPADGPWPGPGVMPGMGGAGEAASLITLAEAAERLGVHYLTAYKRVRDGRLPAIRQAGRWYLDPVTLVEQVPGQEEVPPGRGRIPWSSYRERLFHRLLAGDEPSAWRLVETVLRSQSDPAEAYVRLLSPVMLRIGDYWADGRATVADEHRASAVALRLIGRAGPWFSHRGRTRGTVVLGCAPTERHAIPVAIIADVLRADGWSVVDLGADVPAAEFATAVTVDRLRAVAVSASTPGNEHNVRAAVAAVRRAAPATRIYLGGAAVRDPAAAAALGGDGWARDARAFREELCLPRGGRR